MKSDNTTNYLYQSEYKKYLREAALLKINDYLGKGKVKEAFELVALSTVLTVTEIKHLELSLYSSNLIVYIDAHFKGVHIGNIKPYLFALLAKAVVHNHRNLEHILELLNNALLKAHSSKYHYLAFTNEINVGHDDSHYWVVTTNYKIGNNEGVHTSLVSDVTSFTESNPNLTEFRPSKLNFNQVDDETFESYPATGEVIEKIIAYQEAYKFSGGTFNINKKKQATFVLDGVITHPKKITQVTADEYEALAKHVQSSTMKLSNEINIEVNKALKYVLEPFAEKLDSYPLFFYT